MFKNMKLATKIIAGFGLVLAFLVVVGVTGYVSLHGTVGQMQAISTQLEIAKKVNDTLALSQDGQAGSLRFILYQDQTYLEASQQANNDAIGVMEAAKGMMHSEENRRNADKVAESAKAYIAANSEYGTLMQKRVTAGTVRSEAADNALESIARLIARREQFLEERSSEANGSKVTPYEAIAKTLLAQTARNAFNRAQTCAQKYQLAITPEDQDAAAVEWVKEIQATQDALDECRLAMTDTDSQRCVDETLDTLTTYLNQVEVFRQINRDMRSVQLNKLKPAAEELMAEAKAVRDGVYTFIDKTNEEADAQVALATLMINTIGIVAIILGIVAAVLITRSITKPIQRIIAGLTEGSEQVAAASGQVSAASQSLAEGATEQAAGLEETSSSLEEMSSMTKQNADNAQQANTLASETRRAADTGSQAMQRMNTAIQEIQKSSDETAKIIKVIDEIAFQTNLLALNAAVEAARAGEAGKGFAVVAEEVRNLAMRSAEAAKNTASMIEESVKNSKNGVDIAGEVGKVLDEIVGSIGKTTDLVSEIAAASAEQAQGIDQVNTAVAQMDKVTQQNAANAEESASASEELSSQAESMNDIVAELVALVGGKAGGRSAQSTGRATHRSPARAGRGAAQEQHSISRTNIKSPSRLAANDHIFHKIAGKPSSEGSIRQAIPLGEDDDMNGFNS